MDVSFDKLVTLTPVEDSGEALICGPDGCIPVPEPESEPEDNA